MNTNGTVNYDGSHMDLGHLAAGATFTDTFTYTIRMADGALSTAMVTVEIADENDRPTLASIDPVSIHGTAIDNTPPPASGTLLGHDVDDGAVLNYAVNEAGNNEFGSITLDATSGAYRFTADADKIDALHAGENITVSYDAVVTDEHGAQATRTLAFTLVGANDTATMGGDISGSVAEDSATLHAGGTLTVADRDSLESAFQTLDASAVHGTYGDFSFSAAGVWTYLRNGDGNVQALTSADTVFDSLTVFSLDGSASQTISIDIHGADETVTDTGDGSGGGNGLVTTFEVNKGLTIVNGHTSIEGFDGNDQLTYTNNFDFTGVGASAEGDTASFSFHHGQTTEVVTVTLLGFNDLVASNVVPA